MSKKATEFQKKEMSRMYRGKEIFKPLNTGWIDEHVACVREWVANIFFYRKGNTTIMIDAGYNYERLEEKMGWLGIDPKSIRHILITHQDTDHVGAVEADSPGLFKNAVLYVGEVENRYLTGEKRHKVIYHLYKLPQVTINNEKVLLIFAVTLFVAVAGGWTALPRWACVCNTLPLFLLLAPLRIVGTGNLVGAIVALGLAILI